MTDDVLTIENGVVKSCKKDAVDVVIPEDFTKIGRSAFSSCKSLKTISLPSTINEIGSDAFASCNAVESITSESELYPFNAKTGKLYDATKKQESNSRNSKVNLILRLKR